jgi:hypothetical protein
VSPEASTRANGAQRQPNARRVGAGGERRPPEARDRDAEVARDGIANASLIAQGYGDPLDVGTDVSEDHEEGKETY